jgi:retron-type reverse transcriptase
MHRAGNLCDSVASFENLYAAAYRVLRGKRDRAAAGDFFSDLEGSLFRLQEELRGGSYRPGGYRTFWIREPKPRLISAAPFRDRVVHHALVNVIEPVFERRFIHHSYACRTGKGTHACLDQFVRRARSSRYVLKMDVARFFPSLDHGVLKEQIRRAIKDPRVLALCDVIIDGSNEQEQVANFFPGDGLLAPLEHRHGIPIGNLTSQFYANVYLDALDHFVVAGPADRIADGRRVRGDGRCFLAGLVRPRGAR